MEKRCLKLNNKLPDNVCVNLYSISAFITYMEKMSHMWYAILTPELQPTDEVTWILGYMKQYVEERPYYILWLFINNTVTDDEIIEEIEKFLGNDVGDEDEGE